MHSFKKQESCAVAMETQNPPLSLPLISSSILHDSLQSVNLEPSLRDAISGMLAGDRRKQQEEKDG